MAIRRIEGLLHLASEGRYAILVGRFNSERRPLRDFSWSF